MSEISKEQVQELFDAIMERMQEFELPMPSAVMLTKGAVRVAYDVIAPFVRAQMQPLREEAADKPRERIASDRLASTLGPEHTLNTPLKPIGRDRVPDPDVARANVANMLANGSGGQLAALASRRPRMLAEVDSGPRKGKGGTYLPPFDDVIRELKRQSMAGMMPTQSQFNDAKPGNWAVAANQTQRLKKSWEELAKLCGLKLRQRGPHPREEILP